MLKDVVDLTSHEGKGLNTNPNLFSLTRDQSPNIMNVKVEHDASWSKRLGTITMNSVVITDSAAAGFSPTGSITNNIVAFWPLNEPSGNRSDVVGMHTLLDNNSVLQASGINKQAALFVATNSEYLLHANTSTLSPGNADFAMSSWFYLNSTSTTRTRTIISKRDNAAGADPDNPIDSSTLLLTHMDGVDGATTFTDVSSSAFTLTASNNAQVDTAQFKFGGASALFDSNADCIKVTGPLTNLNFGNNDLTIDCWIRMDTSSTLKIIYRQEEGSPDEVTLSVGADNKLSFVGANNGGNGWTVLGINTLVINQWYHVAAVKSSSVAMVFIDGVMDTSASGISGLRDRTWSVAIGADPEGNAGFGGWIDEFRLSNVARWNSNFTVPGGAFGSQNDFEYWLYVNTDNILTFSVSSSGTEANGTVRATSFGAVTTSTWYNAIAYHSAASDLIAVGINLSLNTAAYASGVRSGSAPFVLGAVSNGTTGFMDGRIDETGFWNKIFSTSDLTLLYNSGSSNTFQGAFGRDPWASFDFGAGTNRTRWLTVAAGTGIYASSNLGVTFVTIATDRTANYQYFERSKNVLVSGSDSYDTPLIWPGSAGTFMTILNVSAPLVKYWVNHIGFLIGLNSSTRKRGFFWEDENTQLTGDWADSFDIPSSADDEITGSFILRRRLYVSTRYYLYGLDYVGGNPDWRFRKEKDFGFVSRTMKINQIDGVGEIAMGLDWGNKLRIFDGADDKIISSQVEYDNSVCDFAMDKISNAGSGKIVSFAEVERNENIYRLCVAIGGNSTQTTHFINLNRNQAFYPDDNRPFNTMTSAESNNTQYMMAFDRSGRCHMLDTGNKDAGVTSIQDIFESSYIYDKSPSQAQKNHMLDLYFLNSTAGRLYIKESINFDKQFTQRDSFIISGTGTKTVFHKSVDVPSDTNAYRFQITTSGGTSDPWRLIRTDFFGESQGIGHTENG